MRRPEQLSLSSALNDLLAAVESSKGSAIFGYDTVQQWDGGALDALVSQGLLKKASAADSLECRGCEEHCFSDVIVQTGAGKTRAHIVCEVPDKQAEMGRVAVPLERLQQWQSSPVMVARFLAGTLGLDADISDAKTAAIRLGMVQSPHGRRWVSLLVDTFSLEINQQTIPLSELLFIEKGSVALDKPCIQDVLSLKTKSAGKAYSSNTDKRETRKQATIARRQDWRDAHEQLQRQHPGKSKRWYSIRIARQSVGGGREAETIRRQL
jgi:hypothetical protein